LCARVEDHLTHCQRCAGRCDALRRTMSLCRRMPGDELPRPVKTALWIAVRAPARVRGAAADIGAGGAGGVAAAAAARPAPGTTRSARQRTCSACARGWRPTSSAGSTS
jgi:hypothetical protein